MEHISKFIAHIAKAGRRSRHTVDSYRRSLADFRSYFARPANRKDLKDIRHADMNGYAEYLMGTRGFTRKTAHLKLVAVRSFLQYLAMVEIPAPRYEIVQLPKAEDTIIEAVDEGEISRLLDVRQPEGMDEFEYLRNRAMVHVFLSTGVRRQELIDLSWDIDHQTRTATVIGKGGKARPVYFTEWAKIAVMEYQDSCDRRKPKTLFFNSEGKKLSPSVVSKVIVEWGVLAGLKTRLHPHRLRHGYATNLVNKGLPIYTLQKLLGHSSPVTTQRYAQIADSVVRKSVSDIMG